MHVRNLVWFLYAKKARQADVIAAGYFDDVNEWYGIRPDRPESLERINARVPVEIVHLSFGRLRLGENDKQWPYDTMWSDLARVIGVFVENVPSDRVSGEFRDAIKKLLPGSSTQTLQDMVSELGRISMKAKVGMTMAPSSYFSGDWTRPPASGGTATSLPSRQPPALDD